MTRLDDIMPPGDEDLADRWVLRGIDALPSVPVTPHGGYRRSGSVEWEWRSQNHYRGALMTITVDPYEVERRADAGLSLPQPRTTGVRRTRRKAG